MCEVQNEFKIEIAMSSIARKSVNTVHHPDTVTAEEAMYTYTVSLLSFGLLRQLLCNTQAGGELLILLPSLPRTAGLCMHHHAQLIMSVYTKH